MAIGQELLNVPMGDMIRSMALAIADAQWKLDRSSVTVAEIMSGQRPLRDLETGQLLNKNGDPVQFKLDANNRPERDANGNEKFAPGPDNAPVIVDSRVYFGYQYKENADGTLDRIPTKASMIELGFVPTFYQFVDTLIEVKIAIHMTQSSELQDQRQIQNNQSFNAAKNSTKTVATQVSTVNATYSNKYNYSAEGASILRTKLVPVPPPPILEERIRDLVQSEKEYRQRLAPRPQTPVQNP
jgi:hypothetical protein